MTASLFLFRGAGFLRMLVVAALLWAAASGSALAQTATISSVAINGSTSTVNVPPSTVVNVAVTYKNGGESWSMTSFTFSPGGLRYCLYTSSGPLVSGTTTRVFKITVPSGSDLYSLAVATHTHSSCKIPTPPGQLASATYTFAGAVNTKPVIVGVDHLQIDHDGIGRTCGAKSVTIKACADLACSSLYTASTSVSLTATNSGSWSPATITFSGGSTTGLLSKTASGTVTMGGTITSPAPKSATTCFKSGVLGSCDVVFSPTSCSLDAVETGKNPATPIYTKTTAGTFKLDVLTLNGSGGLANSTATILARLVDEASCVGASPTLTFLSPEVSGTFAGSRLSYTFAPDRASKSARVRIVNGSLVGCSSDKFAIRPAVFTITASGAGADATGASPSATPILKAGATAFTLTAASAPGYDAQPAFSNDRLAASDVASGVTGTPGDLAGAFVAGAGSASGSFTYSEVGYVKLLPYAVYDDGSFALVDAAVNECIQDTGQLALGGPVADPNVADATGKLGCYFGNSASAYFGRFIPDHFTLDTTTLTDRAALPGCAAPQFSYMGEAMQASVGLSAVNAAGAQTSNYHGYFDRMATPATQLGVGAINDAPGARTPFPLCGATPAHPCIQAGATSGAFAFGVATFGTPLTLFRPPVPAGPYEFMKVGVAPADADGVKLDPATYNIDTVTVIAAAANHALAGSSKARYGRLNIDNGYGSELLNLSLRVRAQYWNGAGYTTNTLDSCTPLPKSGFTLTDYRRGITAANMGTSHLTDGATMANGESRMVLAKPAPVPANTGSTALTSTSTILPGSGRATFGVYKAGPVIYVRETY